MCRLSLNFISSRRWEGLPQQFLFQDQDYQSKNHMRGRKKVGNSDDAKSNFFSTRCMIPMFVMYMSRDWGKAENNQYSIGSTMSHRVSFKCTYTRHTPSRRGLGGLKRLPADRQTYKRRKYFLTFSFNKLSNFRSNKDKHSTHSS